MTMNINEVVTILQDKKLVMSQCVDKDYSERNNLAIDIVTESVVNYFENKDDEEMLYDLIRHWREKCSELRKENKGLVKYNSELCMQMTLLLAEREK